MTTGINGNVYSNLFATFNAKFGSTATWENEILKAAQSWAAQANINLSIIADNGTPSGQGNYQQGDSGMGDIRIGGYGFSTRYLAGTYLPPSANNYSIAGDMNFNTNWPSTSAPLTTSRRSPCTSSATLSAWDTVPSPPRPCIPAITGRSKP
jgi:hypothetical protein